MLFRIQDDSAIAVPSTSLDQENLYEEHAETWIESCPNLLGEVLREDLLLIGRQVQVDEGRDRIDLLAIDTQARLVVIELKRDLIGGTADLQALRYAAMVSTWDHEDMRRQAEGYWQSTSQVRESFALELERHCEPDSELNEQQRIVLVGRDLKPRLGTMALWLRSQGFDIRVVALEVIRDEDRLYAQPQLVIPMATKDDVRKVARPGSSNKPWLVDGQAWHLEQRCAPQGREIVERLAEIVATAVADADDADWGQKHYIKYLRGNSIWASIGTGGKRAVLNLRGRSFQDVVRIARDLDYELFDSDAERADKIALGSWVSPYDDGRIRLTIKSIDDLDASREAALSELLLQSWMDFGSSLRVAA